MGERLSGSSKLLEGEGNKSACGTFSGANRLSRLEAKLNPPVARLELAVIGGRTNACSPFSRASARARPHAHVPLSWGRGGEASQSSRGRHLCLARETLRFPARLKRAPSRFHPCRRNASGDLPGPLSSRGAPFLPAPPLPFRFFRLFSGPSSGEEEEKEATPAAPCSWVAALRESFMSSVNAPRNLPSP